MKIIGIITNLYPIKGDHHFIVPRREWLYYWDLAVHANRMIAIVEVQWPSKIRIKSVGTTSQKKTQQSVNCV